MTKYSITELPFSNEELSGKTDEELEAMFVDKFEENKDEEKEDRNFAGSRCHDTEYNQGDYGIGSRKYDRAECIRNRRRF